MSRALLAAVAGALLGNSPFTGLAGDRLWIPSPSPSPRGNRASKSTHKQNARKQRRGARK